MKSISIKNNLYSNRFFVIYRVLPENRKKAWNGNPWDVGTMGMEGGGGNDRRRVGKRERRSGVHVHSAYLMQSECIGPRISWRRRRRRDAIFLDTKERLNVSFIIRGQISRIVKLSEILCILERWIEEDILRVNNEKILSWFVTFCTIFM